MTLRLGAGDADLARAAELLLAGQLVGLPTETVYGLAVRADDPAAIARLYAAKGRPSDNPLIVHVAAVDMLERVAQHVTALGALLLERFAPGPLTIVLDAHPDLSRVLTGGLDTVAVRIPDHPVALEVLRRCGVPLAAPSANRSGRPSPTTAAHVLTDLDGRIAAVVDGGPTRLGLESTIVDARGPRPVILREGAITQEDLLLVCGALATDDAEATPAARAPGTRHLHYAPGLPVHVGGRGIADGTAAVVLGALNDHPDDPRIDACIGVVLVGDASPPMQRSTSRGILLLGHPADAAELAADLFGFLRRAEELGLSAVVVEEVSEEGIGRAVMDRLRRAVRASGGTLPPPRPADDQ